MENAKSSQLLRVFLEVPGGLPRDNRFTTYYVSGQLDTTYYTSGQLFWGVFYYIEIIAKNVEFYIFIDLMYYLKGTQII